MLVNPPAFALTDGYVELDGRTVLRGVDLRVEVGDAVALLGANGSGKSTLVRALLGLVPLSRGRAEVHGVVPERFRQWHRIGYVPQRLTAGGGVPATVWEVAASGRVARRRRLFPASVHDRRAVTRALQAVGLAERAGEAVTALSGGQQQRVLIARALAVEPDTFVLDEPTAGVDQASQAVLAATLRHLVGRNHTVVLVAHELGPLERLVTRAVVLADGRIVHDGAPPVPRGEHAGYPSDPVHPHAPAEAVGDPVGEPPWGRPWGRP